MLSIAMARPQIPFVVSVLLHYNITDYYYILTTTTESSRKSMDTTKGGERNLHRHYIDNMIMRGSILTAGRQGSQPQITARQPSNPPETTTNTSFFWYWTTRKPHPIWFRAVMGTTSRRSKTDRINTQRMNALISCFKKATESSSHICRK